MVEFITSFTVKLTNSIANTPNWVVFLLLNVLEIYRRYMWKEFASTGLLISLDMF